MEVELREAFARVEARIESLSSTLHAHTVEMARETARLSDSSKAAHRRIDEHVEGHKETRKWFGTLWVAVIGSVLASFWNLFKGK